MSQPKRPATLSIFTASKGAWAVFSVTALAFGLRLDSSGVTWDEPRGFFRGVFRFIDWLKEPSALSQYWPLPDAVSQQGVDFFNHPPLTRILGAVTWGLSHGVLGDIPGMRLASVLMFAGAAALLYDMTSRAHGHRAGFLAAFLFATMPRAAAHAFILSSDITLMSFWVLASWTYLRFRDEKVGAPAIGVAYGLLILSKFTGLLWLPAVLLFERRRALSAFWLKVGGVAALTAWALNPGWWLHPISGFWTHHVALAFARNEYLPITTWYLGTNGLPPWHYVPVMLVATLPLVTFLFLMAGLSQTGGRLRSFAAWQAAFLLLVFLTPAAPRYDGVRLYAALMPWLALLAGLGFDWALSKLRETAVRHALALIVCLHLGGSAIASHPHELDFYGGPVGGAKGAHRLGLESTYYWDAVTPAFCARLNDLLPLDATVRVHPGWADHFEFLKFAGWLRKDLRFTSDRGDFLLLLARQGQFTPEMWAYYDKATPIAVETSHGVPLLLLYPAPTKPSLTR